MLLYDRNLRKPPVAVSSQSHLLYYVILGDVKTSAFVCPLSTLLARVTVLLVFV